MNTSDIVLVSLVTELHCLLALRTAFCTILFDSSTWAYVPARLTGELGVLNEDFDGKKFST